MEKKEKNPLAEFFFCQDGMGTIEIISKGLHTK